MIEAAAKLPPGPEAWEPIFEAYPEVTPDFLLSRRIDPAARDLAISIKLLEPASAQAQPSTFR